MNRIYWQGLFVNIGSQQSIGPDYRVARCEGTNVKLALGQVRYKGERAADDLFLVLPKKGDDCVIIRGLVHGDINLGRNGKVDGFDGPNAIMTMSDGTTLRVPKNFIAIQRKSDYHE